METKATRPLASADIIGSALGTLLILIAAIVAVHSAAHADGSIIVSTVSYLAVLMAALVGLIIVCRSLGITSRKQALGLPKGSVRALLAFGLLLIFTVVALLSLGAGGQKAGTPFLISQTYPADRVAEQLTKYQAQFPAPKFAVVIVPDDPARADAKSQKADSAGPAPSTGPILSSAPDVRAPDYENSKIEVFNVGESDAQKQVLTMIGTALVTVIGFYFGGKSATDAAAVAVSAATAPSAPSGAPAPTIGAIQNLTAQVKALAQAAKALQNDLGDDPLAVLKEATDGNSDAGIQQRLAVASAALAKLTQAVATTQSVADHAATALSSIPAGETDSAKLSKARDDMTQLLQLATTAKSDADKGHADFTAARDDIQKLTAKG